MSHHFLWEFIQCPTSYYNKHRSTGKIFFTGQQRLFDPRYIKAMEMIHAGTFGEINAIRISQNTCLPASKTSITILQCELRGVATSIASMLLFSNSSR